VQQELARLMSYCGKIKKQCQIKQSQRLVFVNKQGIQKNKAIGNIDNKLSIWRR